MAIVLGIVALLKIDFPKLADDTLSMIGRLATPMALIALGAVLKEKSSFKKWFTTLWASMIKLVIQPLIFIPVAVWMGFR